MRIAKLVGAMALAAAMLGLSACAGGDTPAPTGTATSSTTAAPTPDITPVIAPVTVEVGDLQGTTVELTVGQMLNINTGDLAVDSYSGVVADASVARFVAGRDDGSATFNPGVEALAEGTTTVVLSNSDGGIEDVVFTIDVVS